LQALDGAKNHAVVLPDADVEFAANHITAAGYGSAGRPCMAISAVVAVGEAGDTLFVKLKVKAGKVKVGPGRDQASEMGPVVTAEERDRIVVTSAAASRRVGTTMVVGDHENANPYGNGTAIFTTDRARTRKFQRHVQAEMTASNISIPVPPP
jgi:malonate-semialdehyde dehydrogenase (acetylating) / methylmalonate-semialdehyde dehydrogenase